MCRHPHFAAVLSLSALLVACNDSDNDTVANLQSDITIPFQAKAGDADIACGVTLPKLGTTQDSGTINDFAFYVHDLKLKTKAGAWIDVALEQNSFQDPEHGVALLDFQDKTDSCNGAAKPTNKVITASIQGVQVADINGIQFKVGVPEAINHHNASTAIAPYNRSGMFWRWQSGHKFMRLDVSPSQRVQLNYTPNTQGDAPAPTDAATYFFHLGSTGCSGDPVTGEVVSCDYPNRPRIELSENFKVENLTTSPIVLDYAQLMAGMNINEDDTPAVGCMSGLSDIECIGIFKNLGMDHGAFITNQNQKVFQVKP